MTKKLVKVFSITILLVLFSGSKSALANHCQVLSGLSGPHFNQEGNGLKVNSEAKMTGRDCNSSLGNGQYTISNCIGGAGFRYIVTYCTEGKDSTIFPGGTQNQFAGCEEQYPELSSRAPAGCNRPDQGPPSKIGEIFGQIIPPTALTNFGFGALGISQFLSNGITLFYSIAAVVLIFMILWGGFEWMTSGGDKEKLASAQKRIINAVIGIVLFAVAFALIRILGVFTGLTFFN